MNVSAEMRTAWDAWQQRQSEETTNAKEDALRDEAARLGVRQTVLHDHLSSESSERWRK